MGPSVVCKKQRVELRSHFVYRAASDTVAPSKLDGSVVAYDDDFFGAAAQISGDAVGKAGSVRGVAGQHLHTEVGDESKGVVVDVGPLFIWHPDDVRHSDAKGTGDNRRVQCHARAQLPSELTKYVRHEYLMPRVLFATNDEFANGPSS